MLLFMERAAAASLSVRFLLRQCFCQQLTLENVFSPGVQAHARSRVRRPISPDNDWNAPRAQAELAPRVLGLSAPVEHIHACRHLRGNNSLTRCARVWRIAPELAGAAAAFCTLALARDAIGLAGV